MHIIEISIIIVNYNTADLLFNCINSIIKLVEDISYEIIVVDNASSDNSIKLVNEHFPNITLIALPKNVGFGAANNIGTKHAKGKYYLFLNSDTVLLNNLPKILFDFMEKHTFCGICGGNLVDINKKPIHSYSKTLPSPWTDIYRFFPGLKNIIQGKDWYYNFSNYPKRVGYITGADLCIRADLFDKIGGFHKNFFMYYEETELSYRVINTGYYIYSVPEAKAIHIKGASVELLPSNKEIVLISKYRYLIMLYGKYGAYLSHYIFRLFCLFKMLFNLIRKKSSSTHYYKNMYLLEKKVFYNEVIKNA